MEEQMNYLFVYKIGMEERIIGHACLPHPPRIGETITFVEKNTGYRYWKIVDVLYQIVLHEVQLVRVYIIPV